MNTSYSIDWLSLSGSLSLTQRLGNTKLCLKLTTEAPPKARYYQAWNLEPSGKLYISDTERQGSLLTFTGKDLQKLREIGFRDSDTLGVFRKLGTATRIDFALDIHEDVNLTDLEPFIKSDNYKHTFRNNPTRIDSLGRDNGYTLMFGSPSGKRRIRIYDKGAQMELLSVAWKRVELQARRSVANNLMIDMVNYNICQVGKQAIQNLLDFPECAWWSEALEHEPLELTKVPRKESQWQRWMKEAVIPSVKSHMENSEDRFFLEDWLSDLEKIIIGDLGS